MTGYDSRIASAVHIVMQGFEDILPSIRDLVSNDSCLPYIVNTTSGRGMALDFRKKIPEDFEIYVYEINKSFEDLRVNGMFCCDYGGRC